MKVIRLTYRDIEIDPSLYLLLFFRLAGVYVYERFWGTGTIQMEGFGASDGWVERNSDAFESFDCDIYIVRDDIDLQEYERRLDKAADSEIVLTKGRLLENAIDYMGVKWLNLVQQINNALFLHGNITPDEKIEFNVLAGIYDSENLMRLTLQSKYFFTFNDEPRLSLFQDKYEKIITQLLDYLAQRGGTWGERRYFHIQYAALNMIYELNCLCVRYKKKPAYNMDSLLRLSGLLEMKIDGLLGNSVKMLEGQVYDDLFRNPNAAYERYVSCCDENTLYNSYVYFRKGNYWQDFGEDWEQALKYYTQAVRIYPSYYRAWYKIGLCSRKLGKNRQAVSAYENVRKCLANRIEGKCIRPLEIEHIFKAQVQIAEIWEKNGNQDNAIRELVWAERVWNLIDKTSFYRLMCDTEEEENLYRAWTRENLDMENVYERLIVLNTVIGNREAALRYQERLKG